MQSGISSALNLFLHFPSRYLSYSVLFYPSQILPELVFTRIFFPLLSAYIERKTRDLGGFLRQTDAPK